jgi:hypothetical protein
LQKIFIDFANVMDLKSRRTSEGCKRMVNTFRFTIGDDYVSSDASVLVNIYSVLRLPTNMLQSLSILRFTIAHEYDASSDASVLVKYWSNYRTAEDITNQKETAKRGSS